MKNEFLWNSYLDNNILQETNMLNKELNFMSLKFMTNLIYDKLRYKTDEFVNRELSYPHHLSQELSVYHNY